MIEINRKWLNHSAVGPDTLPKSTTGQQNISIGNRAGCVFQHVGNSGLNIIALKCGEESSFYSIRYIMRNKK